MYFRSYCKMPKTHNNFSMKRIQFSFCNSGWISELYASSNVSICLRSTKNTDSNLGHPPNLSLKLGQTPHHQYDNLIWVLTSKNEAKLAKHSIFFSFLCLSDFDILSCSCSGGISEIKEALQEILNSWKEALNGARCSFEEILLSLYLTLFHNKLPLMSPHVLCKTKWI